MANPRIIPSYSHRRNSSDSYSHLRKIALSAGSLASKHVANDKLRGMLVSTLVILKLQGYISDRFTSPHARCLWRLSSSAFVTNSALYQRRGTLLLTTIMA